MTINNEHEPLKSAQIFEEHAPLTAEDDVIKSAVNLEHMDISLNPDTFEYEVMSESPPVLPKAKSSKKVWIIFSSLVVFAGISELVYFVIDMMQSQDWLAAVWLTILVGLLSFVLSAAWREWKGLTFLKRQVQTRTVSQQLYATPAIGLAENHCKQIANFFPEPYQTGVSKWQGQLEPSYTDSEVITLFEKHALLPLDQLALQTVRQNAAASGVMIAVSPFALLDMGIVVWRNVKMINQISEIYGAKLGYWGRVKLVKSIFHTMIYAGAAEILSDAGTYALGAGVTGKLSTRVAQGMGASVLTARIGLKAVQESRPMPFLSTAKPSLTALSKQLLVDLKQKIS